MLAARADDGRNSPFTPVYGTTPGVYRPTPPLSRPIPRRGSATSGRSSCRASTAAHRPPNPLTSRAYARDFNEIKSVGALHSTTRTADQTDAAIFWQEHGFALWNRAFRTIATDRGLSIADSARMFAMADLAGADGAIGCWNNKYRWNTWRPITAVREAAGDGNPVTVADPGWTPLFDPATPWPGGATGHAAVPRIPVRAQLRGRLDPEHAAELLRHRPGRVQPHSNKSGTTRSFDRLSEVLRETIDARSGPASTSATPTSRAPGSAPRSRVSALALLPAGVPLPSVSLTPRAIVLPGHPVI